MRSSDCRLFSPANSFRPASVTCVSQRSSDCRLFSPANSFRPASVTFVPPRSSVCRLFSPASSFSPASVTCVPVRFSDCRLFSPANSFSPASVTSRAARGPAIAGSSVRPAPSAPRPLPRAAEVQRLQALQSGQLLQPRVRYLRAARSSDCRLFSPANSFSPASVTSCRRGPTIAGSSARPTPSAPRPLPHFAEVQRLQVLQTGQLLESPVHYLRMDKVETKCRLVYPMNLQCF